MFTKKRICSVGSPLMDICVKVQVRCNIQMLFCDTANFGQTSICPNQSEPILNNYAYLARYKIIYFRFSFRISAGILDQVQP